MKRISAIAILIILIASLFAGCTSVKSETKHEETISRLTVGTTMAVNDLNIEDYDLGILRGQMTHQGLVKLGPDGGFVPALAESWETADSKRWTFNLVKNATFHDGTPVTSKDVKFNLEYLPAKIAQYKTHWSLIESVETPDDYTVVINLKSPCSNFLVNLLVLRTIPEHIFKDVEDPVKYNDVKATIGCGPYKFDGFDKNAGVLTFKAYDGYHGKKPAIGEIEIRMFKNPDTMVMALQKGEVDTTYIYSKGISYYYVPRLLASDDITIMTVKNTGVPNALWFNGNKSPFNDTRFRVAISYAIDYEELNNLFTAGYGSAPNAGFIPEGSFNYIETRKLSRDLNKSKEMLDAIGMKDIDGDGFRETPDGRKFQPELITRTDNPDNVRVADMMKKYLASAGIDVRVKAADKNTVREILDVKKSHDMAVTGTTPWGMMMWANYGTGYIDSRNIGYSMTGDPEFHAMIDELLKTSDSQRSGELARDIQNYYADNLPAIPLYWNDNIQPHKSEYEGWVNDPMYGIMSYGTFYELHRA